MRDVVTGFYVDVLSQLVDSGTISILDSVLVVCAGPLDEKVMEAVGFKNTTVTNLDVGMSSSTEDAENLSYSDRSFDVVIVHAGLHHCHSPHRALLEMYRVAKKCAVAFESRDSFMIRTAVRLGLTLDYEINAISPDRKTGGVANTGVPNYIYRWTERDVRETISSFDPAYVPKIDFFYDLRLPIQRFSRGGETLSRFIAMAIEPFSKLFVFLFPKQCNEFAFAISKTGELQPWMEDAHMIRTM